MARSGLARTGARSRQCARVAHGTLHGRKDPMRLHAWVLFPIGFRTSVRALFCTDGARNTARIMLPLLYQPSRR